MPALEAVIEIGATGIRLLVVQLPDSDGSQWIILDKSELPIPLGRDVFTTGFISRDTMLQCLGILKRFKEQLSTWQIHKNHISIIATTALRSAKNRDAVLDRIMVKTGFRVKVIDGIEQNRLTYLAVSECFKNQSVHLEGINSIILEIGGGATDLMLIKQGQMAGVHTLGLGTVIIEQKLNAMGSLHDTRRFLKEFIYVTRKSLDIEMNFTNIQQFIALGTEAQIAADICGESLSPKLKRIPRRQFNNLVSEIQDYSTEECVARFKISHYDANALHISLMAYELFLQFTQAESILVPYTNAREGMILHLLHKPDVKLQKNFCTQITASAWNLAKKYKVDENHAECVRFLSLKLFDTLKKELGLNENTRILLETAAILHDIGMFIRSENHHAHSFYIISNSDIFGLSREQIDIIAQVAYSHRSSHSPQELPQFQHQSRETRITILKLTAILRVADAFDRGHFQQISDFTIDLHPETLIIRCNKNQDLTLERHALQEKSNIFEAVFGYKVILG